VITLIAGKPSLSKLNPCDKQNTNN